MNIKPALPLLLLCPLPSTLPASPPVELVTVDEAEPAGILEVRNNHPFPVRETIRFPAAPPDGEGPVMAVSQAVDGGAIEVHYLPVQIEETDGATYGWIDVQLRENERRDYQLERFGGGRETREFEPAMTGTFDSGLPSGFNARSEDEPTHLFDLALIETTEDLDSMRENHNDRVRELIPGASHGEFSLELDEAGPVFRRMVFHGELEGQNRYSVEVTYLVATSGLVDISVAIEPIEIREEEAYLALAKQVPAEGNNPAAIRWKGQNLSIEPGGPSPERTNRMHQWGRDVNWLALGPEDGTASFALLAGFTTNLTREHDGRYYMANDFLVNELLIGEEENWWLIAEIARSNEMENYIPRQFEVPSEDERLRLEYRSLPADRSSPAEIDQAFLTFAGYRGLSENDEMLTLDFGVEGVSFGASYFPHSTFGEHLEYWHSGGLEGDHWWPLFGENWRHFKEEIRRDFRIAVALGMDWIRIHHFDAPDFRESYLETEEGQWMLDYIEFMSEEAREVGLGLFLDFSLSPKDARLVAERFGDVIGYYEIQNEVLLLGAFLDRIDYWRAVRENIREVRPHAPVFVTGGPQFHGLYDRLEAEGFSSDAIGQHAYVEKRQAPEYVRDIAVSLGGFATARGKIPLSSEFNWRTITREPEEAQAEHFWEIANNLLSQRGIPLFLQFQFQETLAVPPRVRGASSHYELLRLDRSPKPQTWAYADLIRRYAMPDAAPGKLQVRLWAVELAPGEEATAHGVVTNMSDRPMTLTLSPELPETLATDETDPVEVTLNPRQHHRWERAIRADEDLSPGYHHLFERIEFDDEIHFGWAAGIYNAPPELDLETPILDQVRYEGGLEMLEEAGLEEIDWFVFGQDAPDLEVNWTFYVYNTLRAATGSDGKRMAHDEADDEHREANLLLVGTPESNPLLGEVSDALPFDPEDLPAENGAVARIENPFAEDKTIVVITGSDSGGVERAASDFILRYWRHAKDAASFREGMPPVENGW